MENPKQLIYAPEELFRLKPEATNTSPANQSITPVIVNDLHAGGTIVPVNHQSFLSKHRWPIAALSIAAMWIGIFIYDKAQKEKEKQNKK